MRAAIAAMREDMSMQRLLTLLARFESRRAVHDKRAKLPPLLVLSDDVRGYSIQRQTGRWPEGPAFIERTFGGNVSVAPSQRRLYLATCMPREARAAKLDGVHWPQRRLAYRRKSATHGLIETYSAHRGLAIALGSKLGFDAILVSTAFVSNSPSAGKPLGAIKLAKLQGAFPKARLYALGGITLATTKRLTRTRICGVALVSFDEV